MFSGAGLPRASLSVPGEAAGCFSSPEEGPAARFGQTHPSQGGRQDAADLREGHAGWDR